MIKKLAVLSIIFSSFGGVADIPSSQPVAAASVAETSFDTYGVMTDQANPATLRPIYCFFNPGC
ncbi:hypothetical protein [Glutamicibacter sp. PS]|uniref:hypothetical protein n=1 Tax=Glutamicibacter sp. PS TaxID=3075634 RepID=UPI00284D2525|nr:hypothetical protein [Glutamicibacter sp. PS]MDR4533615.1 hypothetical protein [Glutamicibacter sp. PS]